MDTATDQITDETTLPVREWLERLSESHGTPGGGAASAMLVAMSASLLAMVAGYDLDDPQSAAAHDRAIDVRDASMRLAEADSRRSGELGAALRDAKDGDVAGADPVPDAALAAARSIGGLADLASALEPELALLADCAARYLMPDLVVAAEAAAAALGGAAATMRADAALASRHADDAPADLAEIEAHLTDAAAAIERLDAARRRIDEIRALAAERV